MASLTETLISSLWFQEGSDEEESSEEEDSEPENAGPKTSLGKRKAPSKSAPKPSKTRPEKKPKSECLFFVTVYLLSDAFYLARRTEGGGGIRTGDGERATYQIYFGELVVLLAPSLCTFVDTIGYNLSDGVTNMHKYRVHHAHLSAFCHLANPPSGILS